MRLTKTLSVLLCILHPGDSATCKVPDSVFSAAGNNRVEIQRALADVPDEQREGMEFLLRNMPKGDLQSLSASYLLENTQLAYTSWENDPLAIDVPKTIFLNNILPYASINERRDNWRADFRKRFLPVIKHTKSRSEAATLLNRNMFKAIGVKYSTQRAKADQSPYESIEGGTASCTGLSVLLIDACRAVGIPARFVGTPLWSNKSGNHSWVEIWDNGWHFTGAAEPTGDKLNRGWFVGQAATATRTNPVHAIYATSFQKTPLTFPCVWDSSIRDIPALNVTDRYAALRQELPVGFVEATFVVRDQSERRVATRLKISLGSELVFEGTTKDEGYDANDHVRVPLKQRQEYAIQIGTGQQQLHDSIKTEAKQELFSFQLDRPLAPHESAPAASKTLRSLTQYLASNPSHRKSLSKQPFATTPLTQQETESVRALLAEDRLQQVRTERAEAFEQRIVTDGDLSMPFSFKSFGERPEGGRSLYVSLHGGGGAPQAVNDRQWENQKGLYQPEEGIYLAPRAPTNTWNLWHQSHIDSLFDRLIEEMVAFEGVDWNRVYLMGYSAGGDGVYQLAPRMADRWAAAAMMAGHPNETSPLGLRNVPFVLQVGGRDTAFQRNQVAAEWEVQLADLRGADPGGYEHFVKIYPNKGHWMDHEDALAIPWMAERTRNPTPKRIVWKQDDVTHAQSYWLGVEREQQIPGSEAIAEVDGQTIHLATSKIDEVIVYLDDRFIDLDAPIKIESEGDVLYEGVAPRTVANLSATLQRRGDPHLSFPSSVTVTIPKRFPDTLVPEDQLPRYSAVRAASPLVIDGRLDEPSWTSSQKTSSFVDLISGNATLHDTRAAILWDDDYLYIGFWLTEPNVDAKYRNRDDPVYYDNDVEVFVAGKDAYYEFEINAHATIYEGFFVWQDAYHRDGYDTDPQLKREAPKVQSFNGVGFKNHPRGKRIASLSYDFPGFKSAVYVDGTLNDDSDVDVGWTVELAFPWKEMKLLAKGDNRSLPAKPGDQWRINLFRFNKYKAPQPARDSGGWSLGKHGVWDSHIPEVFPIVTFVEK